LSKLYELVGNYKNLEELEEQEGLTQEMLASALEGIQGSIEEKLNNLCSYIKNIESDVEGIKNEVARLEKMKKVKINAITSIKTYLFDQLKALNMQKIKTPLFSVGIQKNPASLIILDDTKIPMIYVVPQELVFDKKAILKDLKDNIEIQGCEIKITERIQIR